MITAIKRFMDKIIPEPNSGCWLWTGSLMSGGYGTFKINKKSVQAHRQSYEFFCDIIPTGLIVLHKCDVKCCVNPLHLIVGTQKDNMEDMVSKGRQNKLKGSNVWKAKLTEEQVLEIRNAEGRVDDLAAKYGVSNVSISYIKLRRTWKHI